MNFMILSPPSCQPASYASNGSGASDKKVEINIKKG